MHELADHLTGVALTVDAQLDREFEARAAECGRLAVRVAYAVLRNSADAEEAAQEGFAKAYTAFRRLRDRDRFRSWLVRVVWRTAIDRRRADRRRLAREQLHAAHRELSTQPDDGVARERIDWLWEAVDALPEKLRVVLVLSTYMDSSRCQVRDHDDGYGVGCSRISGLVVEHGAPGHDGQSLHQGPIEWTTFRRHR